MPDPSTISSACRVEPQHGKETGMTNFLTAQSDDRELLEWLANANQRGGGFVSAIARAGLMADPENYRILRPVLLEMRAKYPAYEPSDAVKQEIKGSRP